MIDMIVMIKPTFTSTMIKNVEPCIDKWCGNGFQMSLIYICKCVSYIHKLYKKLVCQSNIHNKTEITCIKVSTLL